MDNKIWKQMAETEIKYRRLLAEYRLLQKAHCRTLRHNQKLKDQLNQNVERIPIVAGDKKPLP